MISHLFARNKKKIIIFWLLKYVLESHLFEHNNKNHLFWGSCGNKNVFDLELSSE